MNLRDNLVKKTRIYQYLPDGAEMVCYYCFLKFKKSETIEQTNDGCAICPGCSVDAVVLNIKGVYTLDFLIKAKEYYFS